MRASSGWHCRPPASCCWPRAPTCWRRRSRCATLVVYLIDLHADEAAHAAVDARRRGARRAARRSSAGPRRTAASSAAARRSSPSCSSGRFRTSWRSRGCIATTTRKAGFPMLPVIEPERRRAGQQAAALRRGAAARQPRADARRPSPAACTRVALGARRRVRWLAVRFATARSDASARALFFGSITYLPLLWIVMISGNRNQLSVSVSALRCRAEVDVEPESSKCSRCLSRSAGCQRDAERHLRHPAADRGYTLIRARRIEQHRRFMIAAFATSSLFLVCYLVYHAQVGSVPFTRQGFVRPLYFTILITHVTLAATVAAAGASSRCRAASRRAIRSIAASRAGRFRSGCTCR